MSRKLAPIALFVYNRLPHTKKTLENLQLNNLSDKSDIYIFSDGAKNDHDNLAVKEVRNYLKTINGFKNISIITRDENIGLANSIISGVSEVIEKHGKIIVLEDDLITSPHFLEFMNDGLDFYESIDPIVSIHGYIYPTKQELPDTFFLRGADCWGWATWKRGWKLFNPNGSELLEELQQKRLTKKFDFDGRYPFTKMLEDQISGKNNSWAIRWHASAFLAGKFTLYPGHSLVQNIGIDGSGTHCAAISIFDVILHNDRIKIKKIIIEENKEAKKAVKNFFKPKVNIFIKIGKKIARQIRKYQNKKKSHA